MVNKIHKALILICENKILFRTFSSTQRQVDLKRCAGLANEFLSDDQKMMVKTFQKVMPQMRKELGISQTDFGKKVGKSRQMISLLERGKVEMTWDTFVAFMYFFKVNWKAITNDRRTVLDDFLDIGKGE